MGKVGNIVKVSQKANYALRAMLELARRGLNHEPMRSAQIAASAEVPEKYLETIMVELSKAGLVESRRGPDGGHRLARAGSDISAAHVLTAVEGPLKLMSEGRPRTKVARELADCTAELWVDVASEMQRVLEGVSLDDLLKRAQARRGVIDFSI